MSEMEIRPAPESTRPVDTYLDPIESLLKQIIRLANLELTFVIRSSRATVEDFESPEFVVDFSGPDADLLLEANAALLDALEYLVRKAVRLEQDLYGRITFDCRDWRRVRMQELKLTAQVAAERVMQTGDPYPLGPMNPRDRRIVHLALKGQPLVRTESQGFGPERKVVILPAAPPTRR